MFLSLIRFTNSFKIDIFFIQRLCGDLPKLISVKGGFGTEVLTFKHSEAITAVNELAALIQPFKDRQ